MSSPVFFVLIGILWCGRWERMFNLFCSCAHTDPAPSAAASLDIAGAASRSSLFVLSRRARIFGHTCRRPVTVHARLHRLL